MPALVQVHLLTSPVSVCTAVQFNSKHIIHTENNEMCSMNKSNGATDYLHSPCPGL